MGQKCFVLDPFGETGVPTAAHNPFAELGSSKREHIAADAAQLADALIIGNPKDPHWTDSAKNLIRGIVLHLLGTNPKAATLREVRRLLNATPAELDRLFTAMVDSAAFDGIVANIGASFLGKRESGGRELQGILSTAQEQTAPLDDVVRVTERSDFRLSDLRSGKLSLYLVLPGSLAMLRGGGRTPAAERKSRRPKGQDGTQSSCLRKKRAAAMRFAPMSARAMPSFCRPCVPCGSIRQWSQWLRERRARSRLWSRPMTS